jgi:hypothetical protein
MAKALPAAANTASPWLASCQEPQKPRWSTGADSDSSVVEAPTSPPAEKTLD